MTTLYNAWYEETFLHLDDLNAIFSSIDNQQVNSFPSSFSFFCFRLYFNREVKVLVTQSCPTLWPHGLWPARLLCPWNSPGKNTGAGCHYPLQGTFLTQRQNRFLDCLSHQGRTHSGSAQTPYFSQQKMSPDTDNVSWMVKFLQLEIPLLGKIYHF